MATYVAGDIQGCFSCLQRALDQVGFNPHRDHLWAVGDLVNRGPQSLETLRFCYQLGSHFKTVLGNHDLHLLAVAQGFRAPSNKDTLQSVLNAPDRAQLLEWLQHQPLLITTDQYTLVHAGIPPQWHKEEACSRAHEVEMILGSETPGRLFRSMYGNQPDQWHDDLEGEDRWRLITNYLTRMRFCDAQGRLELSSKQGPSTAPPGFGPWYSHPGRKMAADTIVFGHWAALNGLVHDKNLIALDTGCVWGGRLRLYCLESGSFSHVSCSGNIQ